MYSTKIWSAKSNVATLLQERNSGIEIAASDR